MINTPNATDASATQDFVQSEFDLLPSSRPSKTQLKNSLERFRKFTAEMVELPQGRFNQLDFPEDIKEALIMARKLTSHGARRRQMSFVARLVADLDIDGIRERVRHLDHGIMPKSMSGSAVEVAALTEVESMAEKLLDGNDQTIFALSSRFDPSERQSLRHFLRKSKKSLEAGGSRTELRKALASFLGTLHASESRGESQEIF